jgi:voltage-gated potassium channel
MHGYLRSIVGHVLTRPGFIFMIFVTFTAIAIASGIFYWIEFPKNPNLHDYLDAVYFSTSTFTTVGYGDISPVTRAGKSLAILMMCFGSLTYVCFMAIVSSSIVELDQKHREERRSGASRDD